MKRIFYLLIVLQLILNSCEKNPIASFSTDTIQPVVGQAVFFYNNSHNSDRFDWDFGDGYVSNETEPVHTYLSTGSFDVTLKAQSKSGHSDNTSMTLKVMIPTLLEIEVREYYSGDLIPDASIILYPTITDWDAQTNKIIEGFTDADGVAVFSDLDPYVYYVDVWEATHDNYALRNEDVGFIRTPEIMSHKINKFVALVDVADHGKGTARGTREMVIIKLGRKAADISQPAMDSGTENWKELYSRSVKMPLKK